MRGQASLTDVIHVSNSCLRRKSPTRKHLEYCAIACDQRHLRCPERSPLHDVRQHARPCLVGHRTCEFVFSRTRLRSKGPPYWWSQTGSNRRPPACKAGALPTELWPRSYGTEAEAGIMVGLGRFELPTSRLSSARSNQLSYKPEIQRTGR